MALILSDFYPSYNPLPTLRQRIDSLDSCTNPPAPLSAFITEVIESFLEAGVELETPHEIREVMNWLVDASFITKDEILKWSRNSDLIRKAK